MSSGYSCGEATGTHCDVLCLFPSFILGRERLLVAVNLVYLTAYFYFCMFRAGAQQLEQSSEQAKDSFKPASR